MMFADLPPIFIVTRFIVRAAPRDDGRPDLGRAGEDDLRDVLMAARIASTASGPEPGDHVVGTGRQVGRAVRPANARAD